MHYVHDIARLFAYRLTMYTPKAIFSDLHVYPLYRTFKKIRFIGF